MIHPAIGPFLAEAGRLLVEAAEDGRLGEGVEGFGVEVRPFPGRTIFGARLYRKNRADLLGSVAIDTRAKAMETGETWAAVVVQQLVDAVLRGEVDRR